MRRSPCGRQRGQLRSERAAIVEELFRPIALKPLLEKTHVLGISATLAIGTWCARHVPSTGSPSTSFGPVQPFGVP